MADHTHCEQRVAHKSRELETAMTALKRQQHCDDWHHRAEAAEDEDKRLRSVTEITLATQNLDQRSEAGGQQP